MLLWRNGSEPNNKISAVCEDKSAEHTVHMQHNQAIA